MVRSDEKEEGYSLGLAGYVALAAVLGTALLTATFTGYNLQEKAKVEVRNGESQLEQALKDSSFK